MVGDVTPAPLRGALFVLASIRGFALLTPGYFLTPLRGAIGRSFSAPLWNFVAQKERTLWVRTRVWARSPPLRGALFVLASIRGFALLTAGYFLSPLRGAMGRRFSVPSWNFVAQKERTLWVRTRAWDGSPPLRGPLRYGPPAPGGAGDNSPG